MTFEKRQRTSKIEYEYPTKSQPESEDLESLIVKSWGTWAVN